MIGYLSLGAMLFATWRLGRPSSALCGRGRGVLVATRQTVAFYGPLAYLDFPYAALVIWAAALEAQRVRGGAPRCSPFSRRRVAAARGMAPWPACTGCGSPIAQPPRCVAGARPDRDGAVPVGALRPHHRPAIPSSASPTRLRQGAEDRTHGLHDLIVDGPRILGQQVRPAIVAMAALGFVLMLPYHRHGRWLIVVTAATAAGLQRAGGGWHRREPALPAADHRPHVRRRQRPA